MAYPQIEDSLTSTVTIRNGKLVVALQEWPFKPGMRFFRLLKNVIRTVRKDYNDGKGLESLKITVPVLDEAGQPVMVDKLDADGNPTGVQEPKTRVDVNFILQIAETVSQTMDDNSDLMLECVDAALVEGPNALTLDQLRGLRFGDVLALFRETITLNLSEGSSLGDSIKGLFNLPTSSDTPTTPRTEESSPALAPSAVQAPPSAPMAPTAPPAQS